MCETCYKQGFLDGLTSFAVWKDGTQFVGSSPPVTLKKAIEEMENLFHYSPVPCREKQKTKED